MISVTRNISVSGCGMPFVPMGPMFPMGGCCTPGPIFATNCYPYPVMGGCYGIMNNDMAAGYCVGAALGCPGVLKAIGSGLSWGWNNVIKPVGQFIWNGVLKPIGKGLKWVWDHTLGWVIKKISGSSSKASKAEGTVEDTQNA